MTSVPDYDAGLRVRREVLGDEHVERAQARTTPFTADFQDFITRYAWGGVWTREGLDRRTRSAITLAVLTALGREQELELHVRAARRNGLSEEEIAEVLLHTAVYAGVPAANAAFSLAQRVLAQGDAGSPDAGGAGGGGQPPGAGESAGGQPPGAGESAGGQSPGAGQGDERSQQREERA